MKFRMNASILMQATKNHEIHEMESNILNMVAERIRLDEREKRDTVWMSNPMPVRVRHLQKEMTP